MSVFTLDGNPANLFIDSSGQLVNSFKVRGWIDDLGNRPYVAIDPVQNLLYITDPDAGRILVYDTVGQCVGSFGQLSRETQDDSQFASVGGVAVDSSGNVIVADAGSGRILEFSAFPASSLGGSNTQPEVIVPEATTEVTPETSQESTEQVIAPVGVEVTAEVTPESTEIGVG
jgi:DNA-binding beta-propeller fold protein YncE